MDEIKTERWSLNITITRTHGIYPFPEWTASIGNHKAVHGRPLGAIFVLIVNIALDHLDVDEKWQLGFLQSNAQRLQGDVEQEQPIAKQNDEQSPV